MGNDKLRTVMTYGGLAVAGYLLYQYLQSSGLWAQWFGGTAPKPANQFTDPVGLMAYCHANPNGTATYVNAAGVASTSPCAQWIASNAPVGSEPPPVTPIVSQPPTAYQQAIAAMKAAAGNNSQNLDNWAYYWQNGTPFAGAPAGFGVPGSIAAGQMDNIVAANGGNRTSPVSAEQFVAWLNQAPVPMGIFTTGGTGAGMQGLVSRWVM